MDTLCECAVPEPIHGNITGWYCFVCGQDLRADLDAENHARDLRVEHDDGSWRDREVPA